jgi:hypothetical protein
VVEAGTGVCTRILKLKDDRGQALVELAFVLPLVLLLLFGIIDFGLAYNTKNADTNLANLAARSMSVMGTVTTTQSCTLKGTVTQETNLLSWVQCVAQQQSEPVPVSACLLDTSTPGRYAAGDALKVEVASKFNWFGVIGASGGIVGKATSTISSGATNRIEAPMVSGTITNLFITKSLPTCSS